MYLGKIVELAPKASIFEHPRHPYTKALLSAVPVPEPGAAHERMLLHGNVASPINVPRLSFSDALPFGVHHAEQKSHICGRLAMTTRRVRPARLACHSEPVGDLLVWPAPARLSASSDHSNRWSPSRGFSLEHLMIRSEAGPFSLGEFN
jgi:oligopeptide/dipeptide ABC transporter ATP-binding protein